MVVVVVGGVHKFKSNGTAFVTLTVHIDLPLLYEAGDGIMLFTTAVEYMAPTSGAVDLYVFARGFLRPTPHGLVVVTSDITHLTRNNSSTP